MKREQNDDILKGALESLDRAKLLLEERGSSYSAFVVDDYMLKLPNCDPMIGYLQMVHLKSMRAISCSINGNREGLLDSLLDLINYTAFSAAKVVLDKKGEKNE